MAYTPRTIKDRVAVGDDIFIVEDLGNNRIRLIPDPTHVSEPGTPVNKALLQPIEDYLATGVVPAERIIAAGSGLIGGGSLDADRTLSLGTPGTLSGATPNYVTTTSHTHEISVATQAEAEAGTDNVKLMTPLRVKEAVIANKQIEAIYETTITIEPNSYEGMQYLIPNATGDMILMANVNSRPYPVIANITKYGDHDVRLNLTPTRSEGFDTEYTVDVVILRIKSIYTWTEK